ncbi:MAG TPA: GIY-YIG nuclease family protein [Candidatus Competibacteraceae bacterium]|nr:GIY-YIG nuclease family protein [Candidatus Competibacteraceae bacterium]HRZ05760.1 GIY-YIG nuclease family protein [Candidatus Competibacteraceae bacterium]HSA45742.1 GIY-YIG nuclease family protein [Candidatus Competibacteraceae bacterium]
MGEDLSRKEGEAQRAVLRRCESESMRNLRMFDAMPNGPEAKRLLHELPPEERKRLNEVMKRINATLQAQMSNGAGLPADQLVRFFLAEYNDRLRRFGAQSMPTSFNIAEPFFVFPRGIPAFLLRDEQDVSFSFTDFLDFVTSSNAPAQDMRQGYTLKEGVIYNFNSSDEIGSLLLATESGCAYGFSAAGMVRVGDELSIMMECGEQLTPELAAEIEVHVDWPDEVMMAGASNHSIDVSESKRKAVKIGSSGLFRVILFIRFNLKDEQIDGWISYRDMGDMFDVVTNLRETMFKLPQEDEDILVKHAESYIDDRPVLVELAKTLTLLPAYLDAKVGSITLKNVRTQLGTCQSSLKVKRTLAKAQSNSRVMFRKITSIEIKRPALISTMSGRAYVAPRYQIPITGYWRKFADDLRVGHDESGNEVQGRTWVRAHIRHKDKPAAQDQPKIVYVKESLAKAKALLAKYQSGLIGSPSTPAPTASASHVATSVVSPTAEVESSGENGAYIYVMRCPAHGTDIYKVGFTTRDPEERAAELSRNTSTPAVFLVVQAWAVTTGLAAESAAHQALAALRIAGNREFFLAKYQRLREIIEGAIAPWLIL